MKRRLARILMIAAVVLSSQFCYADITPWLDEVVSFVQPPGSSNIGGPATDALGPNDGQFVSIDIPEVLTLAFTDNTANDGPGADLRVFEVANGDSSVKIYGSKDNIAYVLLGTINGNADLDLAAHPGLSFVNFLKFEGLDNGGANPGFDLDAVEALNSVAHITPEGAVPVPGAVLLGAIGLSWAGRRLRRNVV